VCGCEDVGLGVWALWVGVWGCVCVWWVWAWPVWVWVWVIYNANSRIVNLDLLTMLIRHCNVYVYL
jgi:hypothetical protein